MEPILQVNNISKFYKSGKAFTSKVILKAVDNVSFNVCAGEIVGFLGPNGAGKSTSIKIIVGLASSNEGSVTILGHDINKEREKAMRFVGGVIESPDLYLDMSGLQNLKYLVSLHPIEALIDVNNKDNHNFTKREVMAARVADVLELVGLTSRKDDLVAKYSLGMKQRLGIAQALLCHPKLLILDEPANGLDPSGIREIRELLHTLAKEQDMAILVSSHQLAEMQLMCDRVLIINHGKIIAEKSITELNVSEDGSTNIIIRTDNQTKAAAILKEKFAIECSINDNDILIRTSVSTGDITKELVLSGVNVLGVTYQQVKLEDMFMQLTRGDNSNV